MPQQFDRNYWQKRAANRDACAAAIVALCERIERLEIANRRAFNLCPFRQKAPHGCSETGCGYCAEQDGGNHE